MQNISCLSCRVVFKTMEERDALPWHSYNVKRKVHGLEPVTEAVFEDRQRLIEASQNTKKENQKCYCDVCRKTFSNENTLNNHLQSKKHLDAQKAKIERELKTGVVEEPKTPKKEIQNSSQEIVNEENADDALLKPNFVPEEFEPDSCRCLFCRAVADTVEANLLHMSKAHSFLLPDFDYIDDLDGLLDYLGEKISCGCICLCCNRGFHDPHAVRKHMLDVGHTRVNYDTDEDIDELAPFYDYSEQNEEGIDEDDITVHFTGELQLPDGRLLGHRTLARYYKQKFPTQDENRAILINKLLLEYHEKKNTPTSALIKYTPKQLTERQKQVASQRVDAYHQRLRLDAGMRLNKIHLEHFSHR